MSNKIHVTKESHSLGQAVEDEVHSSNQEAIGAAQGTADPLQLTTTQRWSIIAILAAVNLVTSLYAAAFEPALPYIMATFESPSEVLSTLTISVYVLGYVFGPLMIAPLSETYGRLAILHTAWPLFLACLAICGSARYLAVFIVFRAIMGFAGLGFLLMAPAIVADIISPQRRGLAMTLVFVGPSIGPTLGPLLGGFISEKVGWRWIFWVGLMALGATWLPAIFVLRETYGPVLERRAATSRRRQSQTTVPNDPERGQSHPSAEESTGTMTTGYRIKLAWIRPLKILVRSPIVLLVALYTSILNSYLTIYLATLGTTFENVYGFSAGQSGLAYLGLTVGFIFCQFALGKFSDKHYRWMERRNNGTKLPEFRLPPMFIGVVSLPLGALWYGWSIQQHTHWIVPIIGSAFIAVGNLFGYLPCQTYLVDAYTLYAASASGAATIVRSIIATLLPLVAQPMFDHLGYGWGNSVLALIAVFAALPAVLLYKYGEYIRTHPKFQPRL